MGGAVIMAKRMIDNALREAEGIGGPDDVSAAEFKLSPRESAIAERIGLPGIIGALVLAAAVIFAGILFLGWLVKPFLAL